MIPLVVAVVAISMSGIFVARVYATPIQDVTSFTLVDADSDLDIGPITEGAIFDLSTLLTTNFSIRANTTPETVGSVFFELSGATNFNNYDNSIPYALLGNNSPSDYVGLAFNLGAHTITATPYSGSNMGGVAGTPLTRNFMVTAAQAALTEDTAQLCSDGIDNDGDQLIDLADPDCAPFIPHGDLTICKYYDNGTLGQYEQGMDTPLAWNMDVLAMSGSAQGEGWSTGTNSETGCVTLSGLSYGDYRITEQARDGWTQTYPAGGVSQTVTLDSQNASVYFLNYQAQQCTESGTAVLDAVPQGSLESWAVSNTGGNPIFSYGEITSPYDGTTAIQTSVVGSTLMQCPSQYITKTYTVNGNTGTTDLKAYLAFTSTMDTYNFPYIEVVLYDSQDTMVGYQVYYGNGVISGIYAGYAAADPAHYTELPVAAGDVTLDLSTMGSDVNFSKVTILIANYACIGQNSVTFDHLRVVNQCGTDSTPVVLGTPLASTGSGMYFTTLNVGLTSDNSTSIRYTTDGTDVSCSSESGSVYDGTIPVAENTIIKAIGCAGDQSSPMASYWYEINTQRGGGGSGFYVGPQVLGESTSIEGGGGSNSPAGGSISTESQGEVLGASTTAPVCTEYLTDYLWYGHKNDGREVTKLQTFLNDKEGNALPVTGYFGALSRDAVKAFQSKYASEILVPWGLDQPTGNVYKSTKWKINSLMCPTVALPAPQLP